MQLWQLIQRLKELSDIFEERGISDIYTNSKIYEVLMAEQMEHELINGHAHTPDAMDYDANYYEYKHYKTSSSNHTWTFNDISESTIENLYSIEKVLFAVIDDSNIVPQIEKIYSVSGVEVAEYLERNIVYIENDRDMMNISSRQIMENMEYNIICPERKDFSMELEEIFYRVNEIEEIINVSGLLTSNKLWELLVAYEMGHNINPEQKRHDAFDEFGYTYEYKVSSYRRWTFQDISENVLSGYLEDKKIILATVDKRRFVVTGICVCEPEAVVSILKCKLEKRIRDGKVLKRISAGIGISDINIMIEKGDAEWVL